MNYDMLHYI